jgi:hypothetical protein
VFKAPVCIRTFGVNKENIHNAKWDDLGKTNFPQRYSEV